MNRLLVSLLCCGVLAGGVAGCEQSASRGIETIGLADASAISPADVDGGGDAAATTILGDASGSSDAAFSGDAGADAGNPASDASVPDPDAGATSDAGANLDMGCYPADCGTMPTEIPVCFNAQPATVVCRPWIDQVCRWQLICGQ
jgi:hypothetical protein